MDLAKGFAGRGGVVARAGGRDEAGKVEAVGASPVGPLVEHGEKDEVGDASGDEVAQPQGMQTEMQQDDGGDEAGHAGDGDEERHEEAGVFGAFEVAPEFADELLPAVHGGQRVVSVRGRISSLAVHLRVLA